jgi:hypothetical protein
MSQPNGGKPKAPGKKKSKGRSGTASWLWWTLLVLLTGSAAYLYWDYDGRDRLGRTVRPRTPPGDRTQRPPRHQATGLEDLRTQEDVARPDEDLGQRQDRPDDRQPALQPVDLPPELPVAGRPKPPRDAAAPASKGKTEAQKIEALEEPPKAPYRPSSMTRKQAATLVETMFGGKAHSDGEARGRYLFTLDGGKPSGPFEVPPGRVEIQARVYKGPFLKEGRRAFVVLVAAEDPEAPTWENRFVGAQVFAGSPRAPGKAGAAFALDAAQGWFTRAQPLDVDGDGTLELLSEIEYSGQGGLLLREASVRHLGEDRQQVLWTAKTLEDAPGQGAETATAAEFSLEESPSGKGILMQVTHKKVSYKVNSALDRKKVGEEILSIDRMAF